MARFIRRAIVIPILLFLFFVTVGDTIAGLWKGQGDCRVVSVTDGDTVVLWCGGVRFTPTRLTGFDTPEIYSPQCLSERMTGLRATMALRGLMWSAGRIEFELGGLDRYGRRLARMTVDGASVGGKLIARGLARHYTGGRRQGWCDT